jgi:hypothetical protein
MGFMFASFSFEVVLIRLTNPPWISDVSTAPGMDDYAGPAPSAESIKLLRSAIVLRPDLDDLDPHYGLVVYQRYRDDRVQLDEKWQTLLERDPKTAQHFLGWIIDESGPHLERVLQEFARDSEEPQPSSMLPPEVTLFTFEVTATYEEYEVCVERGFRAPAISSEQLVANQPVHGLIASLPSFSQGQSILYGIYKLDAAGKRVPMDPETEDSLRAKLAEILVLFKSDSSRPPSLVNRLRGDTRLMDRPCTLGKISALSFSQMVSITRQPN